MVYWRLVVAIKAAWYFGARGGGRFVPEKGLEEKD